MGPETVPRGAFNSIIDDNDRGKPIVCISLYSWKFEVVHP